MMRLTLLVKILLNIKLFDELLGASSVLTDFLDVDFNESNPNWLL